MGPKERPLTDAEKRMTKALRKLQDPDRDCLFVVGRHSTRIALALVRRGLAHAAVSKAGNGSQAYPWQELAVAITPLALAQYSRVLSPRQKIRPAW